MADVLFPTIKQGWGQKRTRQFNTVVQKSASGRRVAVALQQYALYKWVLVFNALFDRSGNPPDTTNLPSDLTTLLGFIELRQGMADNFLFLDRYDNAVTGQAIATGDSSTLTFDLVRTQGSATRPIDYAHTVTNVKVNGVLKSFGTDYTWSASPATITFASAPAAAAAITADLTYYFRVAFDTDAQEFENQVLQLWKAPTLTLVEVKL